MTEINDQNHFGIILTGVKQEPMVLLSFYHEPLPQDNEQYIKHIDWICKENKDRPLIIGGDCNTISWKWCDLDEGLRRNYVSERKTRTEKIEDLIDINSLNIINEYNKSTFRHYVTHTEHTLDITMCNDKAIDRTKNWKVNENEETLSDHFFISYDIDLNDDRVITRGTTQYYRTKKANWEAFDELLEKDYDYWLRKANELNDAESVETFSDEIMETIKAAADKSIPKSRFSSLDNNWWTPELTPLRIAVNKLRNKYRKVSEHEKSSVMEEYRAKRSEYKIAIKVAKSKANRDMLTKVDTTTIWSTEYKRCVKPKDVLLGQIQKDDNSFTKTDIETNNYILEKFFPEPDPIPQTYDSFQVSENTPLFTDREVDEAVNSLVDNKSPGIDYLSPPIIKKAHVIYRTIFIIWMNACLLNGVFPKYMKCAKVKLIPKPNPNNIKTYKVWRPICLLPVISKVLDRLITWRLNDFLWKHKKLSGNQFGFRPNFGTIDAIRQLIDQIGKDRDQSRGKANRVLLISLDVFSAFDLANWDKIKLALMKRGCPRNIYRLIENYLSERKAVIESETINVMRTQSCGACQGSISGPLLWNILYDDIMRLELPKGVSIQCYADDVIVKIVVRRFHFRNKGRRPADNKSELIEVAEKTLDILQNWGQENGIKFNPSKTKGLVISSEWNPPEYRIRMGETLIDMVNELTILGVIFDRKMDFGAHISQNCVKASQKLDKLKHVMKNVYGLKPEVCALIWTQSIEPTLTYGLTCMMDRIRVGTNMVKLIRVQRSCLSRVAKSYCTASHSSLCAITGITPINIKIEEMHIRSCIKRGVRPDGKGLLDSVLLNVPQWRRDMKFIEKLSTFERNVIGIRNQWETDLIVGTKSKTIGEQIFVAFGVWKDHSIIDTNIVSL